MSLFSRQHETQFAAIIEIGSGSVLVSIIQSDVEADVPTIIWSHREMVPIKSAQSDIPVKQLMASLLNIVLLIDSKGLTALRQFDPKAMISHTQISFTAPWSYTVSKTIVYAQAESFSVTKELIENLVGTVQRKIDEEQGTREMAESKGLEILQYTLSKMTLNGYRVTDPVGHDARELCITYTSDVVDSNLSTAASELHLKILPRSSVSRHAFMHMFYQVICYQRKNCDDVCLIDITYEATELGIVRDGVLEYTLSVPVGINTLVRGYAEAMNIPTEEAYSFLREPYHTTAIEGLPKTKHEAVTKVTEAYKEELEKMFREKDDRLSLPKNIFVHNPQDTALFLKVAIADAAKNVTQTSHEVEEITQLFVGTKKNAKAVQIATHSAFLASQYFHQQHKHNGQF